MPAGSAVRNRSETVTIGTPRGEVEIARQETRGSRRDTGWRWFWLARRKGSGPWSEATTVREAIRKATLLSPSKAPSWLDEAAATAERQITGTGAESASTAESTSGVSDP
jgi:hypothetical protein